MTDETEEMLTNALQGDAAAIKRVAERLKAPPIEDVIKAADARYNFRTEADAFKERHKEELADPAFYARVVDEDSKLDRAAPGLAYRDRLELAFKAAGGGGSTRRAAPKREPEPEVNTNPQDDEEAMDHQEDMDRMRSGRHQPVMNFDEGDLAKPPMDEEDRDRVAAIRAMKKGRKETNLGEGD